MPEPQAFVGLISGTSVDGVDACVATFDDAGQLVELLAYASTPYPDDLQQALVALGQGQHAVTMADYARLDHQVGLVFTEAASHIIQASGLGNGAITAIGSHGQTIFHGPDEPIRNTLQIGDPSLIATACKLPVVADMRRADMAAGGQGAPLAPGLHAALWRGQHDTAIINIGGIANVTMLPADAAQAVIAFDTGPGNGLMDAWAAAHTGQPMDYDGTLAASGTCNQRLLKHLLSDPYFATPPPKSTGRESFNLAWLQPYLAESPEPAVEDVQATLLALTAHSIARAIRDNLPNCSHAYVCGGGAFNPVLMHALAQSLAPAEVSTTESLGLNPDAVEAVAFAWLAMRRMREQPGNLPTVTGASHTALLGAIHRP